MRENGYGHGYDYEFVIWISMCETNKCTGLGEDMHIDFGTDIRHGRGHGHGYGHGYGYGYGHGYGHGYMLEVLGTARLLSGSCRTGCGTVGHLLHRLSPLDRLSSCMCESWSGHQHCRRWQSILVGFRFGSCR